jgi:hypothetical protein
MDSATLTHRAERAEGGDDTFSSLSDLVTHYKTTPMVETSGNVIVLNKPLNVRCSSLSISNAPWQPQRPLATWLYPNHELCHHTDDVTTPPKATKIKAAGILERVKELSKETDPVYGTEPFPL